MPRLAALVACLFAVTPAVAAPPTVAELRADCTLLVNGKPVFPYGYYISTGHTGDLRLKCVEMVHAAGGNVVHIEGAWHEDTRFLDRAAELGVHVVAGHTETEDKLWRVKKYKGHPAIIAWTLYDDANMLSTLPHLNKMNKLVKAAAPNHLTYVPLGGTGPRGDMPADGFFHCADLVGWENYHVARPDRTDSLLAKTESQMAHAEAAGRKFGTPVWILTQTFAWPGGRAPTPAEYRNMCYVGVVNGAKGIMPWSVYYRGDLPERKAKQEAAGRPVWQEWYLPDSPELFAEFSRVAKEVRELAPTFLDSRRTKLDAGAGVSAAHWAGDGGSLLVVANLSETNPAAVKLTLPAAMKLTPAFANRAAGLTANGAVVTGKIAPAEVLVYRLAAN